MAGGHKTSSRSGLGQRESIGNPLNLTLGRRPVSAASTRRGFKGSARVVPQPQVEEEQATTTQPNALGFTAWFEEKIVEYSSKSRPYAITRFRKCIMTYFPEDASLGIEEPKIKNSGAKRRPVVPSRHRRASSRSEKALGGFSFDFGPIRTASRPRRSAQATWAGLT